MNTITIVGLGAGGIDLLSVGTYRFIRSVDTLYVRTMDHPAVTELIDEGVAVKSFDSTYESSDVFEEVYDTIVQRLIELCKEDDVVYAVPGHPLVAEATVQKLIEREREGEIKLHIRSEQSFLDPLFASLRIEPIDGFQLLDALQLEVDDLSLTQHTFIGQVYDAFVASDVKLTAMERYDAEHEVALVTAAGTNEEHIQWVPLYELDRVAVINNLTTVYLPPVHEREKRLKEPRAIREIVQILRSPEGCPWDREQTHESLKRFVIEEAHELVQAIEEEDDFGIVEELGDVLLQVFLHAQIGEENGYFTVEEVYESIAKKMIRRHPHVFGDKEVESIGDVMTTWEEIKRQEVGHSSDTILEGQFRASSSLLTSYNYQKKAGKVGFEWDTIEGAIEKFEEEWNEFQDELVDREESRLIDEFGDLLFTLVNIARYVKVSPEEAMVHANAKFARRFQYVERAVAQGKGTFESYTLEELDQFWDQAKEEENR